MNFFLNLLLHISKQTTGLVSVTLLKWVDSLEDFLVDRGSISSDLEEEDESFFSSLEQREFEDSTTKG